MFCQHCGTASSPDQKFCKHCGATIVAPEGAQQVQSAAPPSAPQTLPPGAIPVPPAGAYPPPSGTSFAAMPGVVYQGAAQAFHYVSPQAAAVAHSIQQTKLLHSLTDRIQSLASTESLEGFSLLQMFSEVFKRRGSEAVEDYILVGTDRSTPPIELIETGWPKPWLFFRLLAALIIAYVGLTVLFMQTGNTNCVPGMMFLGAFAVPLATLTLFFEFNTPRNVSLHVVGKLFLFGAVASLAVALLGYSLPIFDYATMEAGIVEEVAKLLTVVVVMRSIRYKYILNGVLFGATVGAGFAAFETAGYALNEGLLPGLLAPILQAGSAAQAVYGPAMHQGVVAMLQILRLRGILTPLGHVAWTALSAGAFWRVKMGRPTSITMLFDHRFLKAFIIPVALHAIWDAPIQLPFLGNQIITGLITWYVVFGLVQQGLRQVKEEQRLKLESTLATVQASLQAQPVLSA